MGFSMNALASAFSFVVSFLCMTGTVLYFSSAFNGSSGAAGMGPGLLLSIPAMLFLWCAIFHMARCLQPNSPKGRQRPVL